MEKVGLLLSYGEHRGTSTAQSVVATGGSVGAFFSANFQFRKSFPCIKTTFMQIGFSTTAMSRVLLSHWTWTKSLKCPQHHVHLKEEERNFPHFLAAAQQSSPTHIAEAKRERDTFKDYNLRLLLTAFFLIAY